MAQSQSFTTPTQVYRVTKNESLKSASNIHCSSSTGFSSPISANKAALLNFLCMKWSQDEELVIIQFNMPIPRWWFQECYWMCCGLKRYSEWSCRAAVHSKWSRHQIILNSTYIFQQEGSEQVVIHANDTDVIVSCVYYALHSLKNFLKCGCAPHNPATSRSIRW